MEKKNYHKITIADMSPHIHSFRYNENKVDKIFKWLKDWISLSLECGKIHPNYLLPSKADLAFYIGVSQGTIQNVFRLLEDEGYVKSKQRLGTFIKNKKKCEENKLTSKRVIAIEAIKKYIIDNKYEIGDVFISTRKLSQEISITNTTLRSAIVFLINNDILEKKDNIYIIKNNAFNINEKVQKTLVEKTADSLREYINNDFHAGEKLPSNKVLSEKFQVSVKTIHDAIKILTKEGLLYTRRGHYGTVVLGNSSSKVDGYIYEQYEQKLRELIHQNYQIGDKLPSIKNLALSYNTSEKTIKKALDNLYEEGYITFVRGRWGGTFITDIPQPMTEAYKWLALNDYYIQKN